MNAKFIVLLSDKKVDDITAGITSNSTKGLVIPPVKKTSMASCARSYAKYIVELKLLNKFFFSLNCKKILVKIPKKMTILQLKNGKSKFMTK